MRWTLPMISLLYFWPEAHAVHDLARGHGDLGGVDAVGQNTEQRRHSEHWW